VSNDNSPISTPFKLRFRRIRYQVLPFVAVAIAAVAAAYLWSQQLGGVQALGEVNAARVPVASKTDGVLVALPKGSTEIRLYARVKKNDLIARLDNSMSESHLKRLATSVEQLEQELEAKTRKGPTTGPAGSSSALPDLVPEREFLVLAPRDAEVEEMADPDDATPGTRDPNAGDHGMTEPQPPPLLDRSPASLRIAIADYQGKIEQLTQRMLNRDIKAPCNGVIVQLLRGPGQAVTAGKPIAVIAPDDDEYRYIMSYVRPEQPVQPLKGMEVDLRIPGRGRVRTTITNVGPQIERVPDQQLSQRNRRTVEWGLPVQIAIPKDVNLRAGELVRVIYRRGATTEFE